MIGGHRGLRMLAFSMPSSAVGFFDPAIQRQSLSTHVPQTIRNPVPASGARGALLRPSLAADVRKRVQEHVDDASLSKYAMPDRIILVEALEKTSVGKIDKRMLRERYALP